MSDVTPRSESILGIVNSVYDNSTLLPEFQRDFRWELDRTYDLFDSLAKDIFIGTIIYGKPSFAISCRQLDIRPRRGKGSRAKLELTHFTEEKIKLLTNSDNFRLVLDGQQRITSIYRAVTGIDSVYLIIKDEQESTNLEDLVDYFSGTQDENRVSIKLSDAYEYEVNTMRESTMFERFKQSKFVRIHENNWSDERLEYHFERYLQGCTQLRNLFKREKLVSYYLLDMSLDKFCLFFERSNSRGIQLNFTDILAAKLYSGFNLRESIDKFESDNPDIKLNRELIVRAVSYLSSNGNDIDKGYILKNLGPDNFNQYWDEVCDLYVDSLNFLYDNRFMLAQSWLPSENMILPLMMFFRELHFSKHPLNQEQYEFLVFWFWASVFANRYTGATNEVIIDDSKILIQIAHNNVSLENAYLRKLRSRITDSDDILTYQKRASSIYKGLLNIINFASDKGLLDWTNTSRLTLNQTLHDHHIFPRAFIRNSMQYANQPELQDIVNSVANRALIPKLTNLKIGSKPPSKYLGELHDKNPLLLRSLESHKIDELVLDDEFDTMFDEFVHARANEIFQIVENIAIKPLENYLSSDDKRIPIFAEYQGQRFDALLLEESKRVEINDQLLSPSNAALRMIHSTGNTDRKSVNGWTFWKYYDEDANEERLIDDLRVVD